MDGNSETNYYKGSCTHTQGANKAWWRVDLGQVEPVSEVYIVNRGDGWTYRLDSFEIRVGRLTFSDILPYISLPDCIQFNSQMQGLHVHSIIHVW